MTTDRTAWFRDARYGMFIHWGPYAVGGRGEWILNREGIPLDEYRSAYIDRWKAERYDPTTWARLARRAGMRYMVLTARHHDGFCLWPTATTPWSTATCGPGRDLIGPYIEAARAEGLRVGLYYSGASWHSPDYPDAYGRDWPASWPCPQAHARFLAQCDAQLRELLTRYGRIDLLWFDGCMPGPFAEAGWNQRLYDLQPDLLINDRNGTPCDIATSEQVITARNGPWEACMTLNDNWGWFASEEGWKPPSALLRMLLMTAKDGGNLLLNVGPRPDGTIPPGSASVLERCGDWLASQGEWLYGSDRTPFSWCEANCWLTVRAGRVYAVLLRAFPGELCIHEIANRVRAVRRLDSGAALPWRQQDDGRLFIGGLPDRLPDDLGLVVAIDIEGEPRPIRSRGQAPAGH